MDGTLKTPLKKPHKKHRNKLEINYAMLEKAGSGALKSQMLFASGVSSILIERYLEKLLMAGLIEMRIENGKKYYYTTEKGFEYLRLVAKIKELTTIPKSPA